MQQSDAEAFLRLIKIMEELREQCPWDKKQTVETLRSGFCSYYTGTKKTNKRFTKLNTIIERCL